jgi:hypothetical protein
MIGQKQMLDIICTEGIEYGGLQEIPGQQHGGRTSFHEAKRGTRSVEKSSIECAGPDTPCVPYHLRLVREADGTLTWEE